MNCLNCNELLPEDNSSATRKYCNDKCRFDYANAKRKKLMTIAKSVLHDTDTASNTMMKTAMNTPFTPPEQEITSISLDEHYDVVDDLQAGYDLLMERINELKADIVEHKSEKKELSTMLDKIQNENRKLKTEIEILVRNHESELNGIAHKQKSIRTEIFEFAKNKEAMTGFAQAIRMLKADFTSKEDTKE
ncbi:MAG: hypothetical protein NTW54_10465 [Bacteroidetes bacterium]|nr:hypothetical protein [Bacteroidota bacterium]